MARPKKNEEVEEKTDELSETLKSTESKKTPGKWVKMSHDEVHSHQRLGRLLGYNPKTGEGLLKED